MFGHRKKLNNKISKEEQEKRQKNKEQLAIMKQAIESRKELGLVTQDNMQLSPEFNSAAMAIAKEFGFDINDLKEAYYHKPDSLSVLKESVFEAKSERSDNIFWTVVATILFWPIALWPGYNAIANTLKIKEAKQTLANEISTNKMLTYDKKSAPLDPAPK